MANKKYKVIYADPPWAFNSKKAGGNMKSGASSKYDTMSVVDMSTEFADKVKSVCDDDCLLVMWWVGSQPREAVELAESWGFRVANMNGFVWNKLTVKGNPFYGMGYYTRAGSESALIAAKGKASNIIADHSVRAVRSARVGEHSAKPLEFRDDIVKMCGDVSRLEMFARKTGEGWDVFGNEVGGSMEL